SHTLPRNHQFHRVSASRHSKKCPTDSTAAWTTRHCSSDHGMRVSPDSVLLSYHKQPQQFPSREIATQKKKIHNPNHHGTIMHWPRSDRGRIHSPCSRPTQTLSIVLLPQRSRIVLADVQPRYTGPQRS